MLKKVGHKYSTLPVTIRAAFWFTVCNILLRGISFLSSFLFTRILPQSEYGLVAIYTSYEQILLILATWEIQLGAYTRGLYKYKNDQKLFTTSMQGLTNILTVIFFIFVFVFYKPISLFTNLNFSLLVLLLFYMLFTPAYNAWLTRKRIVYDYNPAIFLTLLYSVTIIVIPFICVLVFGRTANIKFGASLLSSAAICFVLWSKNCNYSILPTKHRVVKEYWKFMIAYEAPLVVHSLSYLILNQADRIMIGKFVGNKEAALYSVAYSIATIVTLIHVSLEQVLAPWRYEKLDKKQYLRINQISKAILILYGMIIIVFILVAPELIKLFFPASYYEGIWCIPPIAVSAFFMFLYSFFVGIETYFEKTKYVLYVSSACGILNIILNYFGIRWFGYIACAYTTLISYVLFAVGHFIFMKVTLNKERIKEKVYDIRFIFIIGSLILILSFIIPFLYYYEYMRLILLVIGLLFLMLKRNKIIQILRELRRS